MLEIIFNVSHKNWSFIKMTNVFRSKFIQLLNWKQTDKNERQLKQLKTWNNLSKNIMQKWLLVNDDNFWIKQISHRSAVYDWFSIEQFYSMKIEGSKKLQNITNMSRSTRKYLLLGLAVLVLIYLVFNHSSALTGSCQNASSQVMVKLTSN